MKKIFSAILVIFVVLISCCTSYAENSKSADSISKILLAPEKSYSGVEQSVNKWYIGQKNDKISLIHESNHGKEYFYLFDQSNNNRRTEILSKNLKDLQFFIKHGSNIYLYEPRNFILHLITDKYIDYQYDAQKNSFYYIDWDHYEHIIKYETNTRYNKISVSVSNYLTGKKLFRYDKNLKPVLVENFANFQLIQHALKKGFEKHTIEELTNINITYGGNIYNNLNGEYITNIHLPIADGNINNIYPYGDVCLYSSDEAITIYHYGDIVKNYNLPKGEWLVIDAYLKNQNNTKSDLIMLYNQIDHSVYKLNQNGLLKKVCEDVQQFSSSDGELYWMDSSYNAYELSWLYDNDNILIGKNVVGISPFKDERAGFLVTPGDPRCNKISEGYYLCTMYGDKWLNIEKSSAIYRHLD